MPPARRRAPSNRSVKPSQTTDLQQPFDGAVSTRRPLLACWLIVAAGCLAYANSFAGVFVYDDLPTIVENRAIRSLDTTWSAQPQDIPMGLWRRPVGRWTVALNYAAGGLNPWGYHALNLAVHLIAALLLFDLIRRTLLLPQIPPQLQQAASMLALATALIWTVHPLQTESVTYIIQRLESIVGMFYLATIYCLLRGCQSRHPLGWYSVAAIACWLGVATKEVMVTAPVVALLYDRIFLTGSWKQTLRQRGALHAILIAAAIFLVWRSGYLPIAPQPPALPSLPDPFREDRPDRWNYLLSQPGVLVHYLKLCYWPAGQCLDYMWPVADSCSKIVLPGLVIVGLLAATFVALWYRPRIGFVGLASFLVLAPTSTIIPLRLAFEHRMYLPLAGVAFLSVLACYWLMLRLKLSDSAMRRGGGILCAVVCLSLLITTINRNRVYHSMIAIYTDNVAKAPWNHLAYLNLGTAYFEQGEHQAALQMFQRATELEPEDARPWANLGYSLQTEGEPDRAIEALRRAIQIKPGYLRPHRELAVLLQRKQQWPAAREHFERALEINASDPQTLNDYAIGLAANGDPVAGEAMLRRCIDYDPNRPKSHFNLAMLILRRQGANDDARAHLRWALSLDPNLQQARQILQQLQSLEPSS
ncbi:TPR repeat-containing protein YrrB [Rosistilla carotiformis]|uniref:TPR repeat-containing protein YrrB n=1 Tax=Rosistilla carotiformis TaxID=2528017 RepID=A0A518K0V5_9BACT|nr:TPR repeat-containing protein YrrB [Rosistilla carotiformis]